jgi:hypothetical protein
MGTRVSKIGFPGRARPTIATALGYRGDHCSRPFAARMPLARGTWGSDLPVHSGIRSFSVRGLQPLDDRRSPRGLCRVAAGNPCYNSRSMALLLACASRHNREPRAGRVDPPPRSTCERSLNTHSHALRISVYHLSVSCLYRTPTPNSGKRSRDLKGRVVNLVYLSRRSHLHHVRTRTIPDDFGKRGQNVVKPRPSGHGVRVLSRSIGDDHSGEVILSNYPF